MRMNPLIALFTDFGTQDAYVAQMKGAIFTIHPEARVVDLSHEAGQFDVRGAAYLLAASAAFFPAQTITVAVVDPGVGSERRPLMLQTDGDKWFIGPDNGLFTEVIAREGFRSAAILDRPGYYRLTDVSATFHGRDIFAPAAAHLAAGISPEQLGSPATDVLTLPRTPPRQVGHTLIGEILHIDHFGNVVTNLTLEWLRASPLYPQAICIHRANAHSIQMVNTYAEGESGRLLGLLNSDQYFEFAVAQGRAEAVLGAEVGDVIELRPSMGA